MSVVTFSQYDFDSVLDDIEKYLGYLRANENFLKYWQQTRKLIEDGTTEDMHGYVQLYLENYYDKVPCPEGRFAFKPREGVFVLRFGVNPPWTEDDSKNLMDSIKQGLEDSYRDGLAWASGVAAYCRSVCDQMTSPDVDTLADAILDIGKNVIQPLLGPDGNVDAYSDDWALVGSVLDDWQGNAADEAEAFYTNFNDIIHYFANTTGWMNYGVCAFATLVRDVQTGLQGSVEKVRQALIDQLDEWVDIGYQPPEKPDPLPKWVADVEKIGGDALTIIKDKVPVVGNITEKVDNLITDYKEWKTLVEDVQNATGWDILPKIDKPVYVRTADEIYTGLTDALYNDYYQKYLHTLDDLQTGHLPAGLPTPDEAKDGSPVFSGKNLLDQLANSASQTTFPKVGSGNLAGGAHY